MTSTTMTRLCASAVVCTRSMALVATFTAVSKPKVKSVPARSLSMVLGTPTTFTPLPKSLCATESVSSPPMAIRASQPWCLQVLHAAFEAVGMLGGIGARGPQNRSAARQNAADRREVTAPSSCPRASRASPP